MHLLVTSSSPHAPSPHTHVSSCRPPPTSPIHAQPTPRSSSASAAAAQSGSSPPRPAPCQTSWWEFPADAILSEGSVYGGVPLYAEDPLNSTKLPVVYATDCGSRLCGRGELDKDKVAGKMVLCERGGNARVDKGAAVGEASGIGMILANTEESGEELITDSGQRRLPSGSIHSPYPSRSLVCVDSRGWPLCPCGFSARAHKRNHPGP
ncbi:hypothetical protein ZWY2020_051890 [Hordeum vulgare]|nr:hypothetical protein ZWY2020_051890 [Hordeum vulgare]